MTHTKLDLLNAAIKQHPLIDSNSIDRESCDVLKTSDDEEFLLNLNFNIEYSLNEDGGFHQNNSPPTYEESTSTVHVQACSVKNQDVYVIAFKKSGRLNITEERLAECFWTHGISSKTKAVVVSGSNCVILSTSLDDIEKLAGDSKISKVRVYYSLSFQEFFINFTPKGQISHPHPNFNSRAFNVNLKAEIERYTAGKLKKLLDYSRKPYDIMKKTKAPPSHWMGFELELYAYNRDRFISRLDDLGILGTEVICKRDGSLSSYNGVEVVSRPMSFKEHIELLKILEPVIQEETKSPGGYGLHIHVSRDAFKQNEAATKALNKIVVENRSIIEKFARREETSYCEYGYNCRGAINLYPTKTVEFRMFASTTKMKEVLASLAFARSLTLYCSKKYADPEFSFKNYLDTLNLKIWPVLKDYMGILRGEEDPECHECDDDDNYIYCEDDD